MYANELTQPRVSMDSLLSDILLYQCLILVTMLIDKMFEKNFHNTGMLQICSPSFAWSVLERISHQPTIIVDICFINGLNLTLHD